MDQENRTWERLLYYRRELVELCELVDDELTQNRLRRAAWHDWTMAWKKIWLSDGKRGTSE